jgi:Arc/MetJ-type ribon-helix-helix transcriptional regulator
VPAPYTPRTGVTLKWNELPELPAHGRKFGRIIGMKVSVSLPGEDVAFLDACASAHEYPSRSAVVHQAIRALRFGELHEAYGASWAEWEASGEANSWDAVVGDGV